MREDEKNERAELQVGSDGSDGSDASEVGSPPPSAFLYPRRKNSR